MMVNKIRAQIIISGDVQGVTYRAFVKRIARMNKIKGIVRNVDDKVEIFCECDEKTLQDFKDSIKITRKVHSDIYSPHVEDIEVFREREKAYKKDREPKEFKAFAIDYGKELTRFEEESLTRTEIGGLLLVDTRKETINVGENVKEMHNGMKNSFTDINDRYHTFGEKLETVHEDLKDLKDIKESFKLLVNYFIKKDKELKE